MDDYCTLIRYLKVFIVKRKKNHPIKSTQFTGKEIGRNLSGNGSV